MLWVAKLWKIIAALALACVPIHLSSQILLPTRDNRGRKFKRAIFSRIRKELVGRFGGLTAYSRSPARGVWKSGQATKLDDIVVLEIMTANFRRSWWRQYRRKLEHALRQDEIVVRVQAINII